MSGTLQKGLAQARSTGNNFNQNEPTPGKESLSSLTNLNLHDSQPGLISITGAQMHVANSNVPEQLIGRLMTSQGTPSTKQQVPGTQMSIQKSSRPPNSQAMITRPSARKN